MISAMIDMIIGPVGRAIRDFYFENQSVINIIFLFWAGAISYGSIQLNNIRKITIRMGVEFIKNTPHLSDERTWETFLPKWRDAVIKTKPGYILNRWNIWITKATPEKLIEIMKLGPDWFTALRKGEVLRYRFALPGKNLQLSMFMDKKTNKK